MLEEKLISDFRQAMKDKDTVKSATLSFLRSQLKYVAIEKKAEKLSDADVIPVIKKQIKQRQDSIEQFEKGGRPELAKNEKDELDMLMEYMPEQMSEDAIRAEVKKTITEMGVSGLKDMGKVIGAVMAKIKGKADGTLVSKMVKEELAG